MVYKGFKHSEETRKKISESLKKNNPMFNPKIREKQLKSTRSLEFRKKQSIISKQKWANPEYRIKTSKKISEVLKGHPNYLKFQTEEAKKKISMANKGNKRPDFSKWLKEHPEIRTSVNNPAWQGGISFLPYGSEFNALLKKKIWQRDNYTCQLCRDVINIQTKNKFITVHHIDYNKLNNNENNLISLCNFCNSSVNTERKEWTEYFQNKVLK